MADEAAALPSLADDLVDLARSALKPAGVEIAAPDGRPAWWADQSRPIALDYAVMELLVEIRDQGKPVVLVAEETTNARQWREARQAVTFDSPVLPGLEVVLTDALLDTGYAARESIARTMATAIAPAVRASWKLHPLDMALLVTAEEVVRSFRNTIGANVQELTEVQKDLLARLGHAYDALVNR